MAIKLKAAFDLLAIITGVVSAFCWYKSATAEVKDPHNRPDGATFDGPIISKGKDVVATLEAQSSWNKWAAIAASLSAGLATITKFLPED